MRRRSWLSLAGSGGLFGDSCSEKLPIEFGDVEVVAVDLAGTVISGATAELYRGKEPCGLRGVGYGRYRMEVMAQGFLAVSREITVAQRKTVLRVGMNLGMSCFGGGSSVHGQVRGLRAGETYWVKAVPVRGVGGEEVQVDGGGTFVIPGLPPGDYIVLVLHGDAVVAQTAVRTYPIDRPAPLVRIDLTGVTK